MKHLIIILVTIFTLGIASSSHGIGLGDIDYGKVFDGAKGVAKAAKGITPAEEYYIGRAVAANILSDYRLLNNTALTKYVNKVGMTVARSSDKPFTYGGYHFAVLDTSTPNAFACPGGIVFITKGLLNMAKNEDQLAGILAHEVAHIAHSDGISAIKKSRWTKVGVDTAMAVGSHYTPDQARALADAFSGVVSEVSKKVLNNEYGKNAEKKADSSALKYMANAGYNPNALVALLETDDAQSAGTSDKYLSMHAKPGQRVAWLKKDISKNGWGGTVAQTRTTRFNKTIAKLR
jgi:predicted Zn-dependent protease